MIKTGGIAFKEEEKNVNINKIVITIQNFSVWLIVYLTPQIIPLDHRKNIYTALNKINLKATDVWVTYI